MNKELEKADRLLLETARIWLEQGEVESASNELEQIQPGLHSHPELLVVRCEIYAKAQKWDCLLTVAETLLKLAPKEPQGWIQRSHALHHLKQTQAAFDQLLPAAGLFPKVSIIPYNLACYCAELGRLDEYQAWFQKTMAIDQHAVEAAAI